jgi:hypothetical protein
MKRPNDPTGVDFDFSQDQDSPLALVKNSPDNEIPNRINLSEEFELEKTEQEIQEENENKLFDDLTKLLNQENSVIGESLDEYVSSVIESNRDYMLYNRHISNLHNIYTFYFDALFDDDLRPTTSSRVFRGGASGVACDGEMILNGDPLHNAFLTAGIAKTYEELAHDFDKQEYLKLHLKNLEDIYSNVINVFFDILIETDEPPNEERQKIIQFIELLRSGRYNKEWNYYTSVLEHLDKSCNSLDELTIVKVKKIEEDKRPIDYDQLILDGYIFEVGDNEYYYCTIDNQPVEPIFEERDFYCRVSDNPTSNQKLWPLIFPRETSKAKLDNYFGQEMLDIKYAPGLIDPKTTGPYNPEMFEITSDVSGVQLFQRMQNINLENDAENDDSTNARIFLMDGINNFIKYFGSKHVISDESTIRFVEHEGKFIGLSFSIVSIISIGEPQIETQIETPFELHYGDTTIRNISDFVKENNGIVPLIFTATESQISWTRIHSFAKIIYEGIPEKIKNAVFAQLRDDTAQKLLTHILISLKSFGDSLQVYYAKRLQDYMKIKGFGLPLYISTTDKNVGAESIFIQSQVCIIGTGIRPHEEFSQKYPEFFTLEGTNKEDGSKTITTNKPTLQPEKIEESIKKTCFELLPESPLHDVSIDEMCHALTETHLFNDTGIKQLNVLLENYNDLKNSTEDKSKKKTLLKIDGFLKKTAHVVKLVEEYNTPIEETKKEFTNGKNVLFQKLETIKNLINASVFSKIKNVTPNTLTKQLPTLEIFEQKLHLFKFSNICDDKLIDYSSRYLNPSFYSEIDRVSKNYLEFMRKTSEQIHSLLTRFTRVEIPTATRESKNRTASKGVANLLDRIREEKVSESTKMLSLQKKLEATIICIEELENVDESISRTKKHIAKMKKFKKELEKIKSEIDNVSRMQTNKHKEGMDLENVKNKIVGTIQRLRNGFSEITQKFTFKGGKRLKNKRRNDRFTKKTNYNKFRKTFRKTIRKTFQKNKKRNTCKKYKITSGNNRNYKKHKKTQHKQRKHSRKII